MKIKRPPIIGKVRRIPLGDKRADGHKLQKLGKRANAATRYPSGFGKPILA